MSLGVAPLCVHLFGQLFVHASEPNVCLLRMLSKPNAQSAAHSDGAKLQTKRNQIGFLCFDLSTDDVSEQM